MPWMLAKYSVKEDSTFWFNDFTSIIYDVKLLIQNVSIELNTSI